MATKYIKRHSKMARGVHLTHTIMTILLIITGLFVFIEPLGAAVGPTVVNLIRIGHRVFAVVFIAVPIISLVVAPKGAKHMFGEMFKKWDKDDVEFLVKFVPYLFAPKRVHMPPQHETKSGQRFADAMLILMSILLAISGIFLWVGTPTVPHHIFMLNLLIHDIAFLGICVFTLAHAYLGAGVFQPYRGSLNLMFGDGYVSEADALYHWGHWAEDELTKGENVIEK